MTGRREVIKAGIAVLAGSQVAWGAEKKDPDTPRPPPQTPLMTKAIPSTGERLAVVGVGTNNYSPTTPDERAARREDPTRLPEKLDEALFRQVLDDIEGREQ
jgi:hypothetical protein